MGIPHTWQVCNNLDQRTRLSAIYLHREEESIEQKRTEGDSMRITDDRHEVT